MRKMIADSICGMDDFIKCENSKMLEKRDILVSVWEREKNPYLAFETSNLTQMKSLPEKF